MYGEEVNGWLLNSEVSIPLKKNCIIAFGRLPHDENDDRVFRVEIDDPHISSTHCYVWMIQFDSDTPPVCYFQDVSTNNCFVNNVPVGKGNYRVLHNTDFVTLYDTIGFQYKVNQTGGQVTEVGIDRNCEIKNWVVLPEVLGFGTFGKVQIAYNKKEKGRYYAVKTIMVSQENERSKIEHEILSKIEHPNIIRIRESIIDEKQGAMKLFQELAVGGDLFSYLSQDSQVLKALPESEAVVALYQICNGLYFLHRRGIVHRDLKLDNILVMGAPIRYPHLAIGDFGIAKQHLPLGESQVMSSDYVNIDDSGSGHGLGRTRGRRGREAYWMNTMVGTAEYAAPEINLSKRKKECWNNAEDFFIHKGCDGDGGDGASAAAARTNRYTEKVDSWSLGVVSHILLSGISPFYSDNLEQTISKSRRGAIYVDTSARWTAVSDTSKRFVKGCLEVDSRKRLSIRECFESDMFTHGVRRELIKALLRSPRA